MSNEDRIGLRDLLFGDLPLAGRAGSAKEAPGSHFQKTAECIARGGRAEAESALRSVLA